MLIFSLVLQELKEVGKDQLKVEAELPANVSKNRYAHVLPCKCCLLPPASEVGVHTEMHRDGLTLHRWRVYSAWLLSQEKQICKGLQFPFSCWRLQA